MTLPILLVGSEGTTPSFLPLDAERRLDLGAYIRNAVVIGPDRDNGFPGPAVALDGPAKQIARGARVIALRSCHNA